MRETTGPRTPGRAVGDLTLAGTLAALGFVIAIVGSFGPWVTDLVASSGIHTDGKITTAVAIGGLALLLWGRQAWTLVMLAAMGELVLGGYEYLHLHNLYGHAVAWGVFAVIGGAALAAAGAATAVAQT